MRLTKDQFYPIVNKEKIDCRTGTRHVLKPLFKFSHRTVVLLFELLAILAILCAFASVFFVWRISQGPISVGFAKDYIEEALSNESEDFSVKFDDFVFSWPELKGPFLLDLTGLRVQRGQRQSDALSIAKASVGLSRRALVFGRIRPVSVIIDSPSLELVRSRDGHLNVLIDNGVKEMGPKKPQDSTSPPGQEVAQIFKDMANRTRGSLFSRLREFEIRNASVAIRDYALRVSWYSTNLNFKLKRMDHGVAAMIDLPLPGGKMDDAGISLDVAYRKDSDDFRGIVHVRDVNPQIISKFLPLGDVFAGQNLYFTGDIDSAFDSNFIPTQMTFSGSIPEGDISIPEEYDAPIDVKNIAVAGSYDRTQNLLDVSNISGVIGGVSFYGKASAKQAGDAFVVPITLGVDQAELAQIPPLFPKSEQDGEAYEWLGKNITGGTFHDVALDMELRLSKKMPAPAPAPETEQPPAEKTKAAEATAPAPSSTTVPITKETPEQTPEWAVDMPKMQLAFAFDGAKVQYEETLMPAENARGKGLLDLHAETLDIMDAEADIGDIHGAGVTVKLTDLMTRGGGYVDIAAKLNGPLSTALKYIASPPIDMGEKEIGIDAAKVKGTIAADVTVGLPTVKDVPKDAVKVGINGTLNDIDIPAIVNGLPLSGGPLTLATEDGGFRINGDAKLAGRPTKMEWHQYYDSTGRPYSMQVKANIGADQELRHAFGVDLDEYINGTVPVDVVYTLKNGDAAVDVTGDLTPARITIAPFRFEKPVGMAGDLSLKAVLKDDVLKRLENVNIKSDTLNVENALIDFAAINGKSADLYKGSLPSAQIGKSKGSMTFQVTDQNVMTIKADAPVFDLAPFLEETESSDIALSAAAPKIKKQKMTIALNAKSMLVKNDQSVRDAKSYIEMDDDGDITRLEYDARVGKDNNILAIRFRPDDAGKRTFRLETDNAGEVLYAFGVYENIHGGRLVIYGEPKGEDKRGNIYGTMRMENFRVVKAPALAKLLSLMSLTGISQILGNQGLVFSKLESGFEWRFRPEGNLLIIKDGKTSGSSVGLTFSGVLDRGKKTTDISGTIIPMTEVNSLLSKIPLVGEILGGASGLIAATYSMKGPTSDPRVTVNPLSVLAPGIIRRILFEGGYESKIPGDDEDAAPATKETPQKGALNK